MDNLQAFKQEQINSYFSNMDLTNININQIKSDLKRYLGEEPAVRLNYIKHKLINEDGSGIKDVEKLESVTIIYTVEKEISDNRTAPFPVQETFIIS